MASITVVTGFIPIPGHPRGAVDYEKAGILLDGAVVGHAGMVSFHGETVEETWLWRFLLANAPGATHSVSDNPKKNTMEYHAVQHQKFEWLRRAAKLETDADVYVWIDYGIMHAIPGVTAKVIQDFLARVAAADFGVIRIPGCWDKPTTPHPDHPCWRFCGGVMIVPKALVHLFTTSCVGAAMEYIKFTNNVEWEVNTISRAEIIAQLPIAWYKSDHNQTMFTNFP